jgi:hypothetical protein
MGETKHPDCIGILEMAYAMIALADRIMFEAVTDENRGRVEPLRYDARMLAHAIKTVTETLAQKECAKNENHND